MPSKELGNLGEPRKICLMWLMSWFPNKNLVSETSVKLVHQWATHLLPAPGGSNQVMRGPESMWQQRRVQESWSLRLSLDFSSHTGSVFPKQVWGVTVRSTWTSSNSFPQGCHADQYHKLCHQLHLWVRHLFHPWLHGPWTQGQHWGCCHWR